MTGCRSAIWSLMVPLLAALVFPVSPRAERVNAMAERIDQTLENHRDRLIEVRRDLHAHPELSGEEMRTAGVVAEYLRGLGLDVRTGIGGHGVVGIIVGGRPGPVVAYRADMDAVRSDAPDPVSFCSRTPGIRHICGHDVHTTVALGIADALSSVRADVAGTVKFIFQPAEETGEGAKTMIANGVLRNPEPAAIFAVHCAPLEAGQIGSIKGMALPGLDHITVTLTGGGDLDAAASECARVITGTSTVGLDPSRASSGSNDTRGFIAAGIFSSEDGPGANRRTLSAGVRASDDDAHARARKLIEEGLASIGLPDVSVVVDYNEKVLPALINDADLVQSALPAVQTVVGQDGVIVIDETTPFFSEDFAFYLQKIPGAMYFLGVSNTQQGILGMPHTPSFAVDEDAVVIGAAAMSRVLLHYLETH